MHLKSRYYKWQLFLYFLKVANQVVQALLTQKVGHFLTYYFQGTM